MNNLISAIIGGFNVTAILDEINVGRVVITISRAGVAHNFNSIFLPEDNLSSYEWLGWTIANRLNEIAPKINESIELRHQTLQTMLERYYFLSEVLKVLNERA